MARRTSILWLSLALASAACSGGHARACRGARRTGSERDRGRNARAARDPEARRGARPHGRARGAPAGAEDLRISDRRHEHQRRHGSSSWPC